MPRGSAAVPPPLGAAGTKREFTLENEIRYDRSGPVRWIVSHLLRYPIFPIIALLAAVLNNWAYSMIQVSIGRAFDLVTSPGWLTGTAPKSALASLALTVAAIALTQGISGLARNYSFEFLAQHTERTRATSCMSACSARAKRSTGASASATSWPAPPTTCGPSTSCSTPA